MQKSLLLLFSIYSLTANVFGQNLKTHDFSVLGAYAAYMDSWAVPSGLPGKSVNINYCYTRRKQEQEKRSFHLFSYLNYSKFKTPFVNDIKVVPFHYWRFDVCAAQMWSLIEDSKFNLEIGTGFSFDAYIVFPSTTDSGTPFMSFGDWGLSADMGIKATYKYKKSLIKNSMFFPVIRPGFYHSYQSFPNYIGGYDYSYIFKPSKVAWLANYTFVTNKLDFVIPQKKANYIVSYILNYQSSNVNDNKVRYLQHGVGFGLRF